MSEFLNVSTTTATQADAKYLAILLLEARLVACAQVSGPIASHYWWQGKLETATEWQCTFKTSEQLYGSVENLLLKHHPYETPEVIAVPLLHGSAQYCEWLRDELSIVPDMGDDSKYVRVNP